VRSTRQSKTDGPTDRATDSMTKVGHACTDWSKTRQGADNPTTAGERVGAALERAHPARSGFCGIERSNLFWDETTRALRRALDGAAQLIGQCAFWIRGV